MNHLRLISHRLYVEAVRPEERASAQAGQVTTRERHEEPAEFAAQVLVADPPLRLAPTRPFQAEVEMGWT